MMSSNCDCVNVDFGDYSSCVILDIPEHMAEYKKARLNAGLSGKLSIDKCILPELKKLWEEGIITYGSCCGHKKENGMINVADECIDKMIEFGYEQFPNPFYCKQERPHTFISKTCFLEDRG